MSIITHSGVSSTPNLAELALSLNYVMRSDSSSGQIRGGFDTETDCFTEAAQTGQIAIKFFHKDQLVGLGPDQEPRRDHKVSLVFDEGIPVTQFTYQYPVQNADNEDCRIRDLLKEKIIGQTFSSNREVYDHFRELYIPVRVENPITRYFSQYEFFLCVDESIQRRGGKFECVSLSLKIYEKIQIPVHFSPDDGGKNRHLGVVVILSDGKVINSMTFKENIERLEEDNPELKELTPKLLERVENCVKVVKENASIMGIPPERKRTLDIFRGIIAPIQDRPEV